MTSYNPVVNVFHPTSRMRFLENLADTLSSFLTKPRLTVSLSVVFLFCFSALLAYARTVYELKRLTLF